ncbi:putative phosphoprotein phosphatase [Blattamonas nauphoetae]|uniref:Phosphoprotein phosphatase n=1 Tax=Blattamonas nauphoetae TaxID=2049346 RepID=A0ABQ9XCR6_9EUKA|nr:putative phosphoprotein phosphatase [Blattamonas nauphoetae]
MSFVVFLLISLSSGSINNGVHNYKIIHTTDVHGWINGRPHEPKYTADYSDLLNFVYHSKMNADPNTTVLLFDTGDLVQGTGLSDATEPMGSFVLDVVQQFPYDGLCIGNHELYDAPTIEYIRSHVIPSWNGKYLGANVALSNGQSFTQPFRIIPLENGQGNVVVLGFLYNFKSADPSVRITDLETTMQGTSIRRACATQNIAFIVGLCHVASTDEDLQIIRNYIGKYCPRKPLILLTGHSHWERASTPDDHTQIMESGAYYRQIGLLEFSITSAENLRNNENLMDEVMAKMKEDDEERRHVLENGDATTSFSPTSELFAIHNDHTAQLDDNIPGDTPIMLSFKQNFLATKLTVFQAFSKWKSTTDWNIPLATATRETIKRKYKELELDTPLGYSPHYYKKAVLPKAGEYSAHYLVVDEILPQTVDPTHSSYYCFVAGSAAIRSHIFEGLFVADDLYTLDPFNNEISVLSRIKGDVLMALLESDLSTQAIQDGMRFDEDLISGEGESEKLCLESNDNTNSESVKFNTKYAATHNQWNPDEGYFIAGGSYDVKVLQGILASMGVHTTITNTGLFMRDQIKKFITTYWQKNDESSLHPAQFPTALLVTILIIFLLAAACTTVLTVVGCVRKNWKPYSHESSPLIERLG